MIRLSPNGIQLTIQGEGQLLGTPMVFVRLAGCSIGCSQCDTDYSASESLSIDELKRRVREVRGNAEWIWVTGGEPANNKHLWQILEAMRLCGRVGLATSGMVPLGGCGALLDFLSVSPHCPPSELVITSGSQINLVPGLWRMNMGEWDGFKANSFQSRWVTPMSVGGAVCPKSLEQSKDFVRRNGGWRLGVQAHNIWGVA